MHAHVDTSYRLAGYYREVGLDNIASFLEFIGDDQEGPIAFRISYVDPNASIVQTSATASLIIADPFEYFYSLFRIEVPEEMVNDIEIGLAMLELCCKDYLASQEPGLLH